MTEKTNEPAPIALQKPVQNVEFKAAMLLISMVVLISAAVIYLLYARGAFEATQKLVLVANDAEGVVVGMDVTFSGFPIGRVRRIELNKEGKARMIVEVASKDAHWLRSSSIFTMERGLVGATRLRAFSGILSDPPLPDGAERDVLVGDTAAEIPLLIAAAKELMLNLKAMTASESSLDQSLLNVKSITEKMAGKNGALGVLAGSDDNTKKLISVIERANKLLLTVDGLALKADSQVFGKNGTMLQLNALLADAKTSLKQIDAVLIEAQAIGANVKEVTVDLAPLRAEVESNLRKIEQLVNEINRKWPFERNTEVKLP